MRANHHRQRPPPEPARLPIHNHEGAAGEDRVMLISGRIIVNEFVLHPEVDPSRRGVIIDLLLKRRNPLAGSANPRTSDSSEITL